MRSGAPAPAGTEGGVVFDCICGKLVFLQGDASLARGMISQILVRDRHKGRRRFRRAVALTLRPDGRYP